MNELKNMELSIDDLAQAQGAGQRAAFGQVQVTRLEGGGEGSLAQIQDEAALDHQGQSDGDRAADRASDR